MGPIITKKHIPSVLAPGVFGFFGYDYGKMMEESAGIYDKRKATLETEIVQLIPGFSKAREFPESTNIKFDTIVEGFSAKFVIKTVGLAAARSLQSMQDNQYKTALPEIAKGLKDALLRKRNADAAHVLNQADNSSFPMGDGQPLLSASHPTQSESFSNIVRGDLNAVTLKAMIIQTRKMRDHRGEIAIVEPKQVIGPVDLEEEAYVSMKAAMRPGYADNDPNWIKTQLNKYVPLRYLTDPEQFFLQTDVPNGLMCFDKMKPETDSDYDFYSKAALFSVVARYQYGVGDPRCVIGN